MRTKIEIDIPEGYSFVEYRKVRKNEYFLDEGRAVLWQNNVSNCEYIVLKKESVTLKYRVAVLRESPMGKRVRLETIYEDDSMIHLWPTFVKWATDWIEVEVKND